MGQVWIFVEKTIQFVKIFLLSFQIEERFVCLMLITAHGGQKGYFFRETLELLNQSSDMGDPF
jgi:hypothetical protein